MSHTDHEKQAIADDITSGLKQMVNFFKGCEKTLPIAISALNPHSTSTRKLIEAHSKLIEARQAFEKVIDWEVKVK